MSELGKLRRKDNCGRDECSQVKFKSPINVGCSYTTASSRLNCTPRRSHVRIVSSESENCALARWFWPDLMSERHVHTTSVCASLRWSESLYMVRLPAGSWHELPRW